MTTVPSSSKTRGDLIHFRLASLSKGYSIQFAVIAARLLNAGQSFRQLVVIANRAESTIRRHVRQAGFEKTEQGWRRKKPQDRMPWHVTEKPVDDHLAGAHYPEVVERLDILDANAEYIGLCVRYLATEEQREQARLLADFIVAAVIEFQKKRAVPLVSYDLEDSVVTLWKRGVRPAIALYRAKIHTIRNLLDITAAELLALPQFGTVSLAMIREGLAVRDLRLKGD